MFREFLYQLLFGSVPGPWTGRDYLVAGIGSVIFLALIPFFRFLFFTFKKNLEVAIPAAWVFGITLALGWAGLTLDVFGYARTVALVVPAMFLALLIVTVGVAITKN